MSASHPELPLTWSDYDMTYILMSIKLRFTLNLCSMLLLVAVAAQAATVKAIFPPGVKTIGPYSPGIVAGHYLYVSGQGAKRADGSFPADAAAQTRECLDKIKNIVDTAGFSMAGIVYTQVYVQNAAAFPEVERAWAEYFPDNAPARSMIGVTNLPDNTPVEINAVVIHDPAAKKVIFADAAKGLVPDAVLTPERAYIS